MIRHIFMAPMLPNVTDTQIDSMIEDFKNLDGKVPHMTNFQVGRNLGLFDKKMQLVLTADFSTQEAWENFVQSDNHNSLANKYAKFLDKEHWVAAQIEF